MLTRIFERCTYVKDRIDTYYICAHRYNDALIEISDQTAASVKEVTAMSDDNIVRHCAPTLAGIKTGSIFPCPYENRKTVLDSVRRINHRLKAKGLRCVPLRFSEKRVLIYLYRPTQLCKDLENVTARALLTSRGYAIDNCEKCLVQLARKLRQQEDFPHEIGLFLGYPAEDVCGFIENPACCKCVGCWKVYGDEEAAKKKFAQYKKCTKVYCAQWENGKDIERLAVAG